MRCLCCGKLMQTEPALVAAAGWHSTCVKRFFGTSRLPAISVSAALLEQLALENTGSGIAVPGVQKKLSMQLSAEKTPRLTMVNYPSGYILKPQTEEYAALPEAEALVMQMAAATGIATVPFALLRLDEATGELAYITKRIDRTAASKKGEAHKLLAMEDFCQLDGRLTEDKYRGSYERCGKLIAKYSARPGLDLTELFLRLVFSFVVGNSDMHLKNFSLLESAAGSREFMLSAAYYLLPVQVILPSDDYEMALTLNGKKRNLHRNDFLKLAETIGLQKGVAKRLIAKVTSMKEAYLSLCAESYLPDEMKAALAALVEERVAALL